MPDWLDWYNRHRPHTGVNDRTPQPRHQSVKATHPVAHPDGAAALTVGDRALAERALSYLGDTLPHQESLPGETGTVGWPTWSPTRKSRRSSGVTSSTLRRGRPCGRPAHCALLCAKEWPASWTT
ncbi:hypothetical protein ACFVH6_09670 [Spirillospora sp. NPDC127200]